MYKSLISYALMLLGGYLVGKGLIDDSTYNQLTPAIEQLLTIVITAIVAKHTASRRVNNLVDTRQPPIVLASLSQPVLSGAAKLDQAHPMLKQLFLAVHEEHKGFIIIQTARTLEQQRDNVMRGVSKTMDSGHRYKPSTAVDIGLLVDGRYVTGSTQAEVKLYLDFRKKVEVIANRKGIPLKPLLDWDSGHYELPNSYRKS